MLHEYRRKRDPDGCFQENELIDAFKEHLTAFDKAMSYYADDSTATEANRAQALTYARRFRDDTRTQFPDNVFVPFMEGRLALADCTGHRFPPARE